MSEPALLYEKDGAVATLTLNRPAVRNAINPEMLCRLADAWQDVNDDPAIRVAILTGAGDEAFCAGGDLDKLIRMMQGAIPPADEYDERIKNDVSLIYKGLLRSLDVYKPIVAAVKGFCVAGGLEILNCCDIRVAADDAQFGLAEV
ncbi:MAG: enoyl-CoA hydratase-related protein, partial [Deltaproteobacteria bacterium]|nr:enoyl-CoA hydratase-related protein [Deltaproteobacteria bacterium]